MAAAAPAFEFDVAISFLTRDLNLAEELRDRLAPGLNVFLFTRNQEIVAAGDGMIEYARVFRDRARISLVLHREGWGKTPWTGVEELAIEDRCLATRFASLVLVKLDDSQNPTWLPNSYLTFNYPRYPLEDLVRLINRKVRELASTVELPLSAAEVARRRIEAERYRVESRAFLVSGDGVRAIQNSVAESFQQLANGVQALRDEAMGWIPETGFDAVQCVARLSGIAVQLLFRVAYGDPDQIRMVLRVFSGEIAIPGRRESFLDPVVTEREDYRLQRTQELGICWKHDTPGGTPLSSVALGDRAMLKLMNFVLDRR